MTNRAFSSALHLLPVELVVLQGTSLCNLNCTYCDLSVQSRRTRATMEPILIERFFSELFKSGFVAPEVTVLWHSGEPLTLPPDYYDEAIERILRLKDLFSPKELSLRFGIQTNGVLIDESWCRFFKRHSDRLEVGVSCDGPSDLHDLFRVNWNGNTTHMQTLRGMDLLHSHGIKYKVIAVVTRPTLDRPEQFYKFFFDRREQLSGFHFNILAAGSSPQPDLSYSAQDRAAYRSFYQRLLDLNRASHNEGRPFEILNFAQGAARILATKSTSTLSFMEQASAPLRSINLDARGNVTTFYAGLSADLLREEYGDGNGLCLGNIVEVDLEEMIRSEKLKRMMKDFAASTNACRESCEYFSVCPGGFEILKRQSHGSFQACETAECVIHVKTLVDVLLDDIQAHVNSQAN
jgi:uncharacterized protein